MTGSRTAHALAALFCGLAIAALIFGVTWLAITLVILVLLILTASAEALRDHAENGKNRS